MTEMEYRIQRLKEIVRDLKGKKIALYGTGKNAEQIIKQFTDLRIVALIDDNSSGKYVFDKKVISFKDAVILQLDVIIIAAEAKAEREIVNRIAFECLDHHILLLNMFGINVMDEIRENLMQDIDYKNLTSNQIEQRIHTSDIVCFEIVSVLCESSFYNRESMWMFLEKEYDINQFCYYRSRAEGTRNIYAPYNILKIYETYMADTFTNASEAKKILDLEEKLFLDSIIPKVKMIQLLEYAMKENKKIYLVSDLPYTSDFVKRLLEKIGIEKDLCIIQENIGNKRISAGLLRDSLGESFGGKVLYLGRKESLGYSIAGSYGFARCMIKSSLDYVHDFIGFLPKEHSDGIEKLNDFKSWIIREYNSPFYQDNSEKKIDMPWKIYDENKCMGEELNLIQLITSNEMNDFEHISMPQFESINVSIIIPVHNHFDYTYACLQSIIANTLKVEYEIIIADDRSTDMTTDISEIVDGIKVVRTSENLFFLKNCNQAVKHAAGKYIVFLNNDTQVCYNWLYPLYYLLDSDRTIGLIGSKLLNPDGTVQEAGGLIYRDGSAANYGRGKNPKLAELNYVREADYISGASIMVRRELWDEIGGFDERFAPAYCEDSDLAFEVRKHGYRVVYQPASEVVHFEGVSNGKNIAEGVKKYQEINSAKLAFKWKRELIKQNNCCEEEKFAAKDRKQNRRTVLFISGRVPTYDRDAGSKSIMSYMKLFLKENYIVKFWPIDMCSAQPYTMELQQMGIEVLYGQSMKSKMNSWILGYQHGIEYAFVNYPDVGSEVIDLLKMTSIKIRYYGHDLHYLRLKREYELTNNEDCLLKANLFYEKEKKLIRKSEWVYYPSDVEVNIVKKEFGKENVKQISLYMYDRDDLDIYEPEDKEGIMFIGGIHGPNEDAVLWFLTEIYPDIYKEKQIPFYLVGADRSSKLKQVNVEGIISTGYVSDDELIELYHKVRIVVIPLRYGAGIKGKVVDAMYHKVPIVSTSIGIEGIPMAERCTKIADDAETFKKYVLNLYDNYDELKAMSDQYNEIIHRHFSVDAAWEKIKSDFE